MRKIYAFALAVMLVAFGSTSAYALVDVEGRYWFSDMGGSVKVTDNNVVGSDIDVERDLGMDTKQNFFEGRITLELGSHKLRYAYTPLSWDGTANIERTITFAGRTYSASAPVTSKLELDYHRLGYEYDIIDTLDNRLGVIIELKYFDGLASLKTTGIDETYTFVAPIPTVGLAAQAGLPFLLTVGGEITGISFGSAAYMYDAEAAVNFKPMPFVVVSGGYRMLKVHVEDGNDQVADVDVKGPFISVRADF